MTWSGISWLVLYELILESLRVTSLWQSMTWVLPKLFVNAAVHNFVIIGDDECCSHSRTLFSNDVKWWKYRKA